jgi:hypothetical protein
MIYLPYPFPIPSTLGTSGQKIKDYVSIGRPMISNPYGDIKRLFEEYLVGLLAECDSLFFA